ncbi:MAG TPA: ATP-binding cassette domain-containing protein [Anaerolineae bacterium]|nr:ATP-binding cassette domain-containing protein [Anaerolineae bacterium]MCB0178327.1 ATP-binding cassette domain-containing protein [Anaerolineae bacterium]MCB9103454.1 ATP-binding cassette domain-containing protein [Anaerolineales bacterium]HRV96346.1 ATP-binding cassette domain-containing protein [Anaerolineae bacterium]
MPPVIEVRELTKRYSNSKTNAVDGISFSVAGGEFFTLLGPNGAGKTTTISILTTTLTPTTGSARIAGYDLVKEAGAVRRNAGIIFQKPSLDLNLTAEENVRFHAVVYGLYPFRPTFSLMPKAYKQQITELAEILSLKDDIFKPIKTFSGGMKRKLEIIRSLIHQPKVLFLDEPTVGLDPASRRNLWEYIKRVRRESGTTVFLTTHYLDEAEDADTICIISKGKIVAYGPPEAVKARLIEKYLLIDASDKNRLRTELKQLNIPYSETPLFKISLNGTPTVHQLLKAIDTPLTTVKTHNPSLEDAYLAIVEE